MRLRIVDPEVLGVTRDSVTASFRVEDAAGPVDFAEGNSSRACPGGRAHEAPRA